MKATLILAAALAASVNGAMVPRQFGRPTSRPSTPGGTPDGIAAPIHDRAAQVQWPPEFSIGPPRPTVTFWPNDPDDQCEPHVDGRISS